MRSNRRGIKAVAAGLALAALLAACGSSDSEGSDATSAPAASAAGDTPAASGAGITLAVNPWTGSAVNANVAKVVLESELGTPTTLTDLDENSTWVGMNDGSIDAVLEVWPSGHAADYETYITGTKTVVDMGLLGPSAKIG